MSQKQEFLGSSPSRGTMSKKSKDKIAKERLDAGVKISAKEGRRLVKKGVKNSTPMSKGGMFPSLGDTLYG